MKRLILCLLLIVAAGRVRADIQVTVPVLNGKHGDTLDIPILTSSVTDSGVLAFQFTLVYSRSTLTVLDVVSAGTMTDQPGWAAMGNITLDSVTVGAYGSSFLDGMGAIVKIRCRINGSVGTSSQLQIHRFAYNAGKPAVNPTDGSITIVLTGVKTEDSSQPMTLSLRQNYPNPFNPSTTIGYSLSEGAHVELTVLTPLGQTIRELVREYQAPGEYRVNFDAAGLASGVYFYRLKAGEFIQIRRLTLLR